MLLFNSFVYINFFFKKDQGLRSLISLSYWITIRVMSALSCKHNNHLWVLHLLHYPCTAGLHTDQTRKLILQRHLVT